MTNLTLTNPSYSESSDVAYGQELTGGYGTTPPNHIPQLDFTVTARVARTGTGTVDIAMAQREVFWCGAFHDGTAQARYGSGADEVTLSTSVNISDGAYHHLELNFSQDGARLFVDGVLAASNPATLESLNADLQANEAFHVRSIDAGSNIWSGSVDEVAIFTRQLHTSNFTPPSAPYSNGSDGIYSFGS